MKRSTEWGSFFTVFLKAFSDRFAPAGQIREKKGKEDPGELAFPAAPGPLSCRPSGAAGRLGSEELAAQLVDGDALGVRARLAAGVQGVLLFEVLLRRTARIVPGAEVVQLPPDLLGPDTSRVRE